MHANETLRAFTSFVVAGLGLVLPASSASADTFALDLGFSTPPSFLGGHELIPCPFDARPLFELVTTVPGPAGLVLNLDKPVEHQTATRWGTTYMAAAYLTFDGSALITLPEAMGAFYVYVRHASDGLHPFTVETDDGTSLSFTGGTFGARGSAFYVDGDTTIRTVRITSDVPFWFGQLAIAHKIPAPATAGVLICSLMTVAARRR